MSSSCSRFKLRGDTAREVLAEFLGTFILLSFGDGSVAQAVLSHSTLGSALSIHWSWGIGVTMGIYVAGGVSGGHLNPAVTLTMAILGRCSWRKVIPYMAAQYMGAFSASTFVYLVYLDALQNFDGGTRSVTGLKGTAGIWATYPQEYVSTGNCVGDQVFGTALLLICVMAITDPRNIQPSKGITAISVGLSVVVIGMTFGLNCGYAINPARDLGPRIFTAIAGWGTEPFSFRDYNYFWVPVVATHVGAVVGAYIYQLCIGFHWPDQPSAGGQMSLREVKDQPDRGHEGPYTVAL